MIAARTSELPECPECGSDHWSVLYTKGRYVRLACDRCGNVWVEEADSSDEVWNMADW